ncbi:sodium-coupled monocarboxylate transporter 1-like isoform X1 [Ciona intestinalis]
MSTTTQNSGMSNLEDQRSFSAGDYAVFGSLFFVSALIGLFFAYRDRNKKSAENYLLAGRTMSGWPVALSLTASFMSAITVLGTPAEIYIYGTMFWWFFIAYTIVAIVTATIFVPVFYKLGISSTYEYLEMRFNRSVRIAGTCAFIIQTVLYMGMVMYMPALALNKVTGLSLIVSIVVTSLVCIFYTCIGGMKAVVWNDVVQCFVMWIGFVAIIIKGCSDVGGISKVISIANENGRIDFWRFDLDPRIRHSFWSIIIGGSLMWLSVYAINQSMVQRYLSCRSLAQAKLSLYLNDIGLFLVVSLASLTGLIMFAVYNKCDPLTSGKVEKSDQLIPYLVMDILHSLPGIPGIFVAAAYSGTLSTVSTGINALACSTYEDLIKPAKPDISDSKAVLISKILVIIYGLLGLGVAFLSSLLDKILTMALKMFGIIGGPLLGIFCLGIFTPVANSKGALTGLIGGLAAGLWLAVGSYMYPPTVEFTRALPLPTVGCISLNVTSSSSMVPEYTGLANTLYALSYCHYSTFLVLFTWTLGVIVSILTGGLKSRHDVNPRLLAFGGDVCCCLATGSCVCKRETLYIDDEEEEGNAMIELDEKTGQSSIKT